MAQILTLDVRGLPAPEPMVRVLDAVDGFVPGDRLTLLIDCEALPLYRILDRNGYKHRVEPGTDARFKVEIWVE
jgi:TusA-related sulfurtransferase